MLLCRMNYAYEAELAKEYQNGRLLMLMLKLGLINERPDVRSTLRRVYNDIMIPVVEHGQ